MVNKSKSQYEFCVLWNSLYFITRLLLNIVAIVDVFWGFPKTCDYDFELFLLKVSFCPTLMDHKETI